MKTILFTIGIVLVAAYFGITATHNYIFYISNLEKIEFEKINEYCYGECKTELENKGFTCHPEDKMGYVCIPPIDEQSIDQRKDYWDQLYPVNYGYLDLVYADKDFSIGLLKKFEIIDENSIKATFNHDANGEYFYRYTVPDYDYEYTIILNVGDTFVPRCHDENIMVYKLHDIEFSDDVSYVVLIYRIGTSEITQCVFPELLENSFDVEFDI